MVCQAGIRKAIAELEQVLMFLFIENRLRCGACFSLTIVANFYFGLTPSFCPGAYSQAF
jgi:hypothetical protein